MSLPQPLPIHPLHYPINCFCFHLPHLCPQRYSKDLELLLDHGPHQGMSHTTEVDFITDYQVKQRHVFQDTGAKSMACIWACPVIQAPICMAASTGNLSDPKKWWQKWGDPNFAAERFSFEERDLVDQELMKWLNQSKSNMSLNESLVSQEKTAWIKNELKKHVPYQYVPYERAERAL